MFLTDTKYLRALAGENRDAYQKEFVQLANHVPALIYIKDLENHFTFANEALCRVLGRPLTEIIGKTTHDLVDAPWADEHYANDMRAIGTGKTVEVEELHQSSDGEVIYLTQKVPIFDDRGKVIAVAGISTDITARAHSAVSAHRSTRALRALSAVNEALIREKSEAHLYDAICRAIVADGEYRLAWVGEVRRDAMQSVAPAAAEGQAAGYAEGLKVTWGEGPTSEGPTGRAVKTRVPVFISDTETDESFSLWRDRAREFGLRSVIAVPLILSDEEVFGALTIYAAEPNSFAPDEVELLQRMADDLSYGVEAMRMRVWRDRAELALRRSAERLEGMVKGVVETLGTVVEVRDPYTKGHQQGVAKLGRLIAEEMGLPHEAVDTVEIGALVHDIGKLTIPTETLTKPSRLSSLEYELIKEHSRVGYEMLSHVDFGKPIAEIAWQHHERMDGSGYPRGLKGDEILMATRVIMVADVIEAMASDRPYRAALGVQVAVDEVLGNPHLFDADVLSAVKRLHDRNELTV